MAETIKAAAIAANNPFTSLSQLRKRLGEVFPFTLSRELLRVVIIKKQGLSKKKAKFFSKPTNLEAVTDAFLKKRDQLIAEGRTFVSIDETSFGRHGAEVRGYAPVGKPLVIKRARPRITTVSSLAAVTRDQILQRKEVEGSFNKERFLNFLKDLGVLLFTLPPFCTSEICC